jgi:hypothetical protein
VGATLEALPTLEVAVGGRRRPLAGGQLVRVHAEAHRAARLAPVEPGLDQDLGDALGLGRGLHEPGAGHDHRLDAVGDRAALHHLGDRAQVLDPPVGARADEHLVELEVPNASPP